MSSSLIPQKRELNDSNGADSSSPKRPKENTGSSITTKPIEEILKFYQMFLNFHRLEKDKFIELTKLKERLSRENGLYNDLSQAMIDTDFTTVRNMPLLQAVGITWSSSDESVKSRRNPLFPGLDDIRRTQQSQKIATLKSWQSPYIDKKVVTAFRDHIDLNWRVATLYVRALALFQSSGVGKSKLLDEIAKDDFTIPICMRDPKAPGYPPSDKDPYNLLVETPIEDSARMALCFLGTLFSCTADWIEKHGSKPAQFREFMTEGQTMDSHGAGRVDFYNRVCVEARKRFDVSSRGEQQSTELAMSTVATQATNLIDVFTHLDKTRKRRAGGTETRGLPASPSLYLVFDEAHTLTSAQRDTNKTHYTELTRALQALKNVGILTVFMSTTGAISQLASFTGVDPSARLLQNNLTMMPPWTTFGWDQLWQDCKIKSGDSITDLVRTEKVVMFGRPLWGLRFQHGDGQVRASILAFAAIKLLARNNWETVGFNMARYFACLAQRMCLGLVSTTYQEQKAEKDAVQNHLRICMMVNEDRESFVTMSPSEPIVSEAAALIMEENPNFVMVDGLKAVLGGFGLDQVDRGELVAMALFTQARDLTVKDFDLRSDVDECLPTFTVPQFLSRLLNQKTLGSDLPSMFRTSQENITFDKQFGESTMHFNHFIQPHTQDVFTTRQNHPMFVARGAALRSAKGKCGIDLAMFFLQSGTTIEVKNIGLILVQIKNIESMSGTPDKSLFHAMCPIRLGIFREDEDPPGPIIRIILSLASKECSLTRVEYSEDERRSYGKVTTYDYFASGLDPSVLVPVLAEEKERWLDVLRDSSWSKVYTETSALSSLRKQAPLAMDEEDHFSFFEE